MFCEISTVTDNAHDSIVNIENNPNQSHLFLFLSLKYRYSRHVKYNRMSSNIEQNMRANQALDCEASVKMLGVLVICLLPLLATSRRTGSDMKSFVCVYENNIGLNDDICNALRYKNGTYLLIQSVAHMLHTT